MYFSVNILNNFFLFLKALDFLRHPCSLFGVYSLRWLDLHFKSPNGHQHQISPHDISAL